MARIQCLRIRRCPRSEGQGFIALGCLVGVIRPLIIARQFGGTLTRRRWRAASFGRAGEQKNSRAVASRRGEGLLRWDWLGQFGFGMDGAWFCYIVDGSGQALIARY
jgi:hypothetical protein